MKTTQKELKRLVRTGAAVDVTNASQDIINNIIYNRTVLAYSAGVYGLNGILVKNYDGTLYAVVGRTLNLFQLAY